MTRLALAVVVSAVSAMGGCAPRVPEPGLEVFEGGFDPVRFDGGPMPVLATKNGALGRALRFNIPPFYASALSEGGVVALDTWLERETGLDVEIRAPAAYSYAEIADALVRGEVDVAELSPYQFALTALRGNAVVPLAATVAHGASTYGSYIVTREGSAVRNIADLKGRKIAFVDPLSTSGWLLPAAFLRERGIDLDGGTQVVFTGSHPTALAAVKAGDVDAAAVSSDLLIGEAGLAGPLVVIAKAGRMPYDAIVARADLDPDVLTLVRTALLRLSIHTQEGRAALRAFSSVDGFMPVPPGHYDAVIALAKKAATLPSTAATPDAD